MIPDPNRIRVRNDGRVFVASPARLDTFFLLDSGFEIVDTVHELPVSISHGTLDQSAAKIVGQTVDTFMVGDLMRVVLDVTTLASGNADVAILPGVERAGFAVVADAPQHSVTTTGEQTIEQVVTEAIHADFVAVFNVSPPDSVVLAVEISSSGEVVADVLSFEVIRE